MPALVQNGRAWLLDVQSLVLALNATDFYGREYHFGFLLFIPGLPSVLLRRVLDQDEP